MSFFFWRACLLKLRAARSPLRDGTVVLKTFHWNVFLTHSTSSAPGYGRHQVSSAFFVWCACLLKLRAAHLLSQDAGNEPVARFGAQFHWNVFLTHSTSSARGRRAVCLFLWEIKLRRKRRRCLKQRLFCFGEGELEISFCTIQPPCGRKCGLLCSIFLIARLLLDAAILQNDDAVGVLEEIDAVGDGDDR